MERFESRAENEEQALSAVYRRYKEGYERRCLEDGRLERILSLREFFQWLRTQPEGFFAEVELKERGIAGAVIQMAEKCHAGQTGASSSLGWTRWSGRSRTGAGAIKSQRVSGWEPTSAS